MKRIIFLMCLVAFINGCANVESKPFEGRNVDDPPEGPGLISGEDGKLIIYSQ